MVDLDRGLSHRPGWVARGLSLLMVLAFALGCGYWAVITRSSSQSAVASAGRTWLRSQLTAPTAQLTPQEAAAAKEMPNTDQGLPVLMFHGIAEKDSPGATEYTVTPEAFATDLEALRTAGYHSVSLAQAKDFVASGTPLPARSVLITFDDGHRSTYEAADPILERYGFRAVSFLITGGVASHGDTSYYMTTDEVKALATNGRWEIGGHTNALHYRAAGSSGAKDAALDHLLKKPDGTLETVPEWRARVDADLTASQSWMQDHLGSTATAFAYPYGEGGRTEATTAIRTLLPQLLAAHGYTMAFAVGDDGLSSDALAHDDIWRIRRFQVLASTTPTQLLGSIRAAAPTALPTRPTSVAWSAPVGAPNSGVACAAAGNQVTVSLRSGDYGVCAPTSNPALWSNYRLDATVAVPSPAVSAVVRVRDRPTDPIDPRIEAVVGTSQLVLREVTDAGMQQLAVVPLSPTPGGRHSISVGFTGSTVAVSADGGRAVTATLKGAAGPGGISLGLSGTRGSAITFRDVRLTRAG